MKEDIRKIYEAHVAFELEQFQKKNLKSHIKEEVNAAFSWLEKVSLNDITDGEKVKDFLDRNV
ncbi:MAG TPA: hypothetical protein PLU78_07820, partial [Chitinophagales bacterium]|nr:hypothetical protein [Chitinophagales bacterium]